MAFVGDAANGATLLELVAHFLAESSQKIPLLSPKPLFVSVERFLPAALDLPPFGKCSAPSNPPLDGAEVDSLASALSACPDHVIPPSKSQDFGTEAPPMAPLFHAKIPGFRLRSKRYA